MANNWLSVNEIAQYLNVSRTAVINAIHRNDLKSVHIGRRILIKESDNNTISPWAANL